MVSRSPSSKLAGSRHSLAWSRANPSLFFFFFFSSSGFFWLSFLWSCCWYALKSSLKARWVQSGGWRAAHLLSMAAYCSPACHQGKFPSHLKYVSVYVLKLEEFYFSCSSWVVPCTPELQRTYSSTQSSCHSGNSHAAKIFFSLFFIF